MRRILHIDMDAFYSSVEQRDNPSLKGRPVAVGGSPASRGVVAAASYEARAYGVKSAIPMARAVRLCPSLVIVPPDFSKYRSVSQAVFSIFRSVTPLVEPLSLDEAYLDVTTELTGIPTATQTAETIRREIRDETQLTASAGVAPNKFLAKIASDWKKPDGLFVIRPHQVLDFLVDLPVRKIPGVGKATEKVLLDMSIATVGDVRRFSQPELVERFGKWGTRLWELARGIDESPVIANHKRKSWSSESTFATDIALDEVDAWMRKEAQSLWTALSDRKLVGRTVTVKLRTGDFRTATRRLTPDAPPASGDELASIGCELLRRFEFGENARYRLAGIGLSNFIDEDDEERLQSPPLFAREVRS